MTHPAEPGATSAIAVRGTRGRVLAAIRLAAEPPTIDDLATQLDLHVNTVRAHLDALDAAGLLQRGRRPTGGRGRPHTVYRPTADAARAGDRNYRLLAGVLMQHLVDTSPDPVTAALDAGHGWAHGLAVAPVGDGPGPPRPPAETVLDLLDDMGFDPQGDPGRLPTELVLHNCPFRELVDEYQGVACAVHLGLIEGVLATGHRDAPAPRVGLIPFVTPGRCLVRLSEELQE